MSDRLRLLQIVDSLQPGGMENILVQLLSRLDPDRYEAEVCCLSSSGPFEERLPQRVKVRVLAKMPGFQWSTVAHLRKLIKQGQFDVIHTHHLGGLIYASMAAPWPWRPRLVHSEHSLWEGDELSPKRKWQRRLLFRRAASVFTVSHQQVEQMQRLRVGHHRLFTILNGVDSERFRPCAEKAALRRKLRLNPDGFWLGMVARFGVQKRHVALIEAFEQAARISPSLHLLLVGDGGTEKQRALERLEASPFRERIHWAGFQQDPVPWYQAMDVLVISSSNEGLPNAVLEGMACGLPLVANDVCGVREIAHNDVHGWIGDFESVEHLGKALLAVSNVPHDKLVETGLNARKHIQQQFSVEAMVGAYDTLFTSLQPRTPWGLR